MPLEIFGHERLGGSRAIQIFAALGVKVGVRQSTNKLPNYHFPQGSIDGACGLCCLSTLLALHRFESVGALRDMAVRRRGLAARLWKLLGSSFFTGVAGKDMADAIDALALPIKVRSQERRGASADSFAMQRLKRGELTMIAFRSTDRDDIRHWCLAIGAAGYRTGNRIYLDAILMRDPSSELENLSPYNARLVFPAMNDRAHMARSKTLLARAGPGLTSAIRWFYETPVGGRIPVQIDYAIAVQLVE